MVALWRPAPTRRCPGWRAPEPAETVTPAPTRPRAARRTTSPSREAARKRRFVPPPPPGPQQWCLRAATRDPGCTRQSESAAPVAASTSQHQHLLPCDTTTQPTALRKQSNSERMAGCAVTGNTKRSNRPIRKGTLNSTDVLTSTTQPSAPRMQSNSERMAGCAVTVNTKHMQRRHAWHGKGPRSEPRPGPTIGTPPRGHSPPASSCKLTRRHSISLNRMKTIVVGSSERSGSARRNTDGVHGMALFPVHVAPSRTASPFLFTSCHPLVH